MCSRSVYRRRRIQLHKQQQGLCYYCLRPMVNPEYGPADGVCTDDQCTVEHLATQHEGKRSKRALKNIVVACYRCNVDRGNAYDYKVTRNRRHG